MSISLKHKFVSAIPDGTDATIVRPSNWNDEHDLTGQIPIVNGGTNASDAATALTNLGAYPSSNPNNYTSNLGTVTSVDGIAGTGISISGGPITSSGALTITNTAPDQTVALTPGTGIGVTGTYPNFTITNTSPSSGGTVTSVSGTAPVVSSGGNTPAISMAKATTSVDGYLAATDWATFNAKQPAGNYLTTVTADSPLSGSGTSGSHLVIAQANTTTSGYLSSTDWNTFNGKSNTNGTVTSVSALTLGTTGTDLTSTVATGTTTPVITLNVPTASASNRGALSSSDWSTFNSKQAALVSGTNIKTVNSTTLLGSGDLAVGTVTSVGGTGSVNGLTLTGTVTGSGNLTLGGTLDLSSPPAIGGTAAAAITGTTITGTKFVGISGGTF